MVWFRLTKANRSDAHVTEFNQFNWTFFISINHLLNNTTWLENQTNIQDLRKYFLKRSFLKTSGFNVHMADRLFKSLSILISTWTSLSLTHTHTQLHTHTHNCTHSHTLFAQNCFLYVTLLAGTKLSLFVLKGNLTLLYYRYFFQCFVFSVYVCFFLSLSCKNVIFLHQSSTLSA